MFNLLGEEKRISKVFKENHELNVPNIRSEIFRKTGSIIGVFAPPRRGKTQLLYNLFLPGNELYQKFDNVYFFTAATSFMSYSDNPFSQHERTYLINDEHELLEKLQSINEELTSKKEAYMEYKNYLKKKEEEAKAYRKKKTKKKMMEEESEEKEENAPEYQELEYSCIILDDLIDFFKIKKVAQYLKSFLIKSRHVHCTFIFLGQYYYAVEKSLRKLITMIILFRPNNMEEWESLRKEVLPISKNDSLKLFNFAFSDDYNHLTIDTTNSDIYKNFALVEKEFI
jgi:hypothetical protein